MYFWVHKYQGTFQVTGEETLLSFKPKQCFSLSMMDGTKLEQLDFSFNNGATHY